MGIHEWDHVVRERAVHVVAARHVGRSDRSPAVDDTAVLVGRVAVLDQAVCRHVVPVERAVRALVRERVDVAVHEHAVQDATKVHVAPHKRRLGGVARGDVRLGRNRIGWRHDDTVERVVFPVPDELAAHRPATLHHAAVMGDLVAEEEGVRAERIPNHAILVVVVVGEYAVCHRHQSVGRAADDSPDVHPIGRMVPVERAVGIGAAVRDATTRQRRARSIVFGECAGTE